jgi:Restriction endonuclease
VGRRGSWHAARAVLAPAGALLVLGLSASVAAARFHAAPLRGGPWAWLGAAALVVDIVAGLAVLGVPAALRRERLVRSGIADVDRMTGRDFEARLAVLFAGLGYVVARTGATGDFGADLLLERDATRVVVQAKRYAGAVGIEAVQQVIGATRYYDAARALVVTNSTCTPAAVQLALAHDVELVEREALVALLAAHPAPGARSAPAARLVREIAGGIALLWFAAGRMLRLAWWLLRAAFRVPFARRRARR